MLLIMLRIVWLFLSIILFYLNRFGECDDVNLPA
uniref:Uncharacterized protein n=1 Tax=Musa acuminata subsp. malaccensis TaxID=214687 RepID=A0A804KBB4_MUSAM